MSCQIKNIQWYFIICFTGNSIVIKSDGALVSMQDLKVGDEVLVAYQSSDNDITLGYSRLIALDIYQKLDNNSSIDYLKIHTEKKDNEDPLYITPTHSLLVPKKYPSEKEYLFASEVEIDDYLYLTTGNYQSVIEVQVTQINNVKQFYAYLHLVGHLVKMTRRYWLHICLNFQFS